MDPTLDRFCRWEMFDEIEWKAINKMRSDLEQLIKENKEHYLMMYEVT